MFKSSANPIYKSPYVGLLYKSKSPKLYSIKRIGESGDPYGTLASTRKVSVLISKRIRDIVRLVRKL